MKDSDEGEATEEMESAVVEVAVEGNEAVLRCDLRCIACVDMVLKGKVGGVRRSG